MGGGREYYLRDDKGREVAVYDLVSDKLKLINLYGTDQIGHIEVKWTNTWDENYEEWIETRSDRKVYYVKDHLGSIRQSIDINGNMVTASDYYAFGQTKSYSITGTTTDKYRYTGKERDQETGLDYFGARYYDPRTGRWLSVDPLSDKYMGWNPYNYCENNPLRLIDPTGRGPKDKNEINSKGKKKTENTNAEIAKKRKDTFNRMKGLVNNNNKSKQSDELILSIMWKESNFDQSKKAKGTTATGLMMVTVGAAKDAGYDYKKVKTDEATNVQAGSKYIQLRINWVNGDVTQALNGYGTGAPYANDILQCEKDLKENPDEPYTAFEKIHK